MSLSSELIIKPGKSKVYLRLVILLYVLSTLLIIQSSLYLVFKLVLILLILNQLRFDWIHQSACKEIVEIKCGKNEWILVLDDGSTIQYATVHIIIHNILFQVIEFTPSKRKKWLILFNDQIPKTQLRLLHLKTAIM